MFPISALPHLDAGGVVALQQGYRNNWQRYADALAGSGDGTHTWDLCVLTASNEQQAEAYEAQLASRRRAGLLPRHTTFRVIPDPDGARIGSGGATLRVLSILARERQDSHSGSSPFQGQRILIIHSGGDSRRLPICSATGKLFARVPHELPDGRSSSLFDEFLISLSGVPMQATEGVLVASGDVLLLFDHLQLELNRPGVTGVAAAVPAEVGTHHGVYLTQQRSRRVYAFLHKPSLTRLHEAEALDANGRVQVDTGLVWIDRPTVDQWLVLAEQLERQIAPRVVINLYGDLLAPLAEAADLDAYLADTSDGPATPMLQRARASIWEAFRGIPFTVETVHPAIFIHFGTTFEYLQALREGMLLFGACGWQNRASSWAAPFATGRSDAQPILVNANVQAGDMRQGCLLDCQLDTHLSLQGPALMSHVVSQRETIVIAGGVVVEQIPLRAGSSSKMSALTETHGSVHNMGAGGYVTRLYGLVDDPKISRVDGGTFLNRPWAEWLAATRLTSEALWPHVVDPPDQTLWEAQLFPVCPTRDESLDAVLWMQSPECASPEQVERWRRAPRVSLAESYLHADVGALVREQDEIADTVRARHFLAGLQQERPAAELAPLLGQELDAAHRAAILDDWLAESSDPWLPIRGYQALYVTCGQHRYEERAFSSLGRLVRAHTPPNTLAQVDPSRLQQRCVVRLPARIDFGGGWTDTPPYSLERGGAVLNAAIALNGELPIVAEAELLDELALILESRDIESTVRPCFAGEVLDYANPSDPFALLKAALVFRGIVPADAHPEVGIGEVLRSFGHGLRLSTATHIPRGSGLGTSSILAGALLQCLSRLLGWEIPQDQLFDEVLCLEQMITTGGGWQDQVGGLVPGIKLITSQPGLPQRLHVEPVPMTADLRRALNERLLLVYTGQRRLAKDLLRSVMGRWMARDSAMVRSMEEIARLALAMRAALLAVDLDAFGGLLFEHWAVLKAMDPGCTNPFIDDLMATAAPYVCGGKLAGAGGGGYAILIARDGDATEALARSLALRYTSGARPAEAGVRLWPCRVTFS
jgi:fucokinase